MLEKPSNLMPAVIISRAIKRKATCPKVAASFLSGESLVTS